MNQINYEPRIVAFIDILGFTNSVKKSEKDLAEFVRIKKVVDDLNSLFINSDTSDKSCQILQVSDSIVISRLIYDIGGFFHMLNDCALAIHTILNNGFLCRGSIKFGWLFHESNKIFGPAFLEVYKAEENEKLPIVKFNGELFDLLSKFPSDSNMSDANNKTMKLKGLCKSIDGGDYYIDYFTNYQAVVGDNNEIEHYKKLRSIISNGLSLDKTLTAYDKCVWAAKQFERTTNKYDIEPLPINKPNFISTILIKQLKKLKSLLCN
jgi:hypothetical protein